MAESRLDPGLVYPVRRELETADKDFDAWVYETPLDGVHTAVAIGQPRDTFMAEHGVIVYPVYRIQDSAVEGQVGLYEVREDQVPNVLDEDGELRPELLGPPVLYPDLEAGRAPVTPSAEAGDPAAATAEAAKPSTPPAPPSNAAVVAAEEMETAKESAAARKAYRPARGAQWIQKFMKSAKYRVVPNPPNGDCLFASIRQGLEARGRAVTVAELRAQLAAEANQPLFEGYSMQYAMARAEFDEASAATKRLTAESRGLKRRMRGAERSSQMAIAAQAETVTRDLRAENEKREAAEDYLGEFEFMEGISNLAGMKAVLQSQKYWGDTWAVSTLERLLNVKFIIFSKRAFDEGDLDNVLLCGQNNDSVLERRGTFDPDFYILLGLSGTDSGNTHYELIAYDGERALDFAQLPYRVRYLVLTRCLERNAGPYSLIPAFRDELARVQPAADAESSESAPGGSTPAGKAVFQMYGKSAGGPRPGEGTGEALGRHDAQEFADLAAIPNWRRLISDDGPNAADIKGSKCRECLEIDGKRWATVRHYALAARYAAEHPEFRDRLSYDSGEKIGRDVDAATRVAKGARPKKGEPAAPASDAEADAQEMEAERRAREAKFAPGTRANKALVATRDAALRLYVRGAPAQAATGLMQLRDELTGKPGKAT